MSLLFFWVGDNYISDMKGGKAYELNQNNDLILNAKTGEHIWAFTRIEKTYILAADLVVVQTKHNPPNHEYGLFCALGNKQNSRYFDVYQVPDTEPLIRSLSFAPKAEILGHSFQGRNGVRQLTDSDKQLLIKFSVGLPQI